MIVRTVGSSRLLITQPDHAALAARMMQSWVADGLPQSPQRSTILLAIAQHDNGWLEVDRAPIVDSASGDILDFVSAPDDARRGVWPRGVARLAGTPYAAALVAQHALHIYRRYQSAPEWAAFFAEMTLARDRQLAAASRAPLDELLRDYMFLRVADLASLAFCNAWRDEQIDEFGYSIRLEGERLVVKPDPFAGRTVPIEVRGRVLAAGAFASAAEATRAFDAAPLQTIVGVAIGR